MIKINLVNKRMVIFVMTKIRTEIKITGIRRGPVSVRSKGHSPVDSKYFIVPIDSGKL